MPDEVHLTASNGERIAVQRFAPDGWPGGSSAPKLAVIIAPAMATTASFYEPFASWLAEHGCVAYTFDYQGYGSSATSPITEVQAHVMDWADDVAVVARWVQQDAQGLQITWIGHSLGGHLMPFARDEAGALIPQAAINVACGSGYWGYSEGKMRLLAPLLWTVLAPASMRVYGYFPGKKLGVLGDVPSSVMRPWSGWCRNRGYLVGVMPEHAATYASVRIPVTSLSFTDDDMIPEPAIRDVEQRLTGARLEALRVDPEAYGLKSIGHMGFFRSKSAPVWEREILPLLQALPGSERGDLQ